MLCIPPRRYTTNNLSAVLERLLGILGSLLSVSGRDGQSGYPAVNLTCLPVKPWNITRV